LFVVFGFDDCIGGFRALSMTAEWPATLHRPNSCNHTLNKGVPLNLLSKWIGHSIMEITAIYANAIGEEQQAIAARIWC
jgi:hypothetical protein